MLRSTTLLLLVSLLVMLLPAGAQDDDTPTIGVLRYSLSSNLRLSDQALLDMLEAYGYLNNAERAVLEEENDLYGEKLNIIWRNAGSDLPTANIMVDEALDRGVDVLLTVSTSVTQIAVNATRDMEDPPAILFNIVSAPYISGIADAPCIKPDHVTGTSPTRSYEDYVALVFLQNPDISVIGTMVVPSEPQSVKAGARVREVAESLGLSVETASIATISEVMVATETLLDSGAEALVLGMGSPITASMPTVLQSAIEYGIPVYSNSPRHIYRGVTVGAGFSDYYGQGVVGARMLIGHLNGDLDIGTTGIHESFGHSVALNLDSAEAQGIEIPQALRERAVYWIEGGETYGGVTPALPEMTLEERMAEDAAFLDSLHCTPEMIAEQQAELDAASD